MSIPETPSLENSWFDAAIRSNESAVLRVVRHAAVVALVAAATAAASQVSIALPFTPVPLTLQPIAVVVGAVLFGARISAAGEALFLALGVAGLPVFAASPLLAPGAMRLAGPTAGYLLAYPAAAYLTGWLAECRFARNALTCAVAMCAGLAVIYAGGVSALLLLDGTRTMSRALHSGVIPFVGPDLVIIALSGRLVSSLRRVTAKRS